jgi:glycosyltransferase involved in cell wall biosynthesis
MALKILSISKNDWAGCGYFLSDAINECTEHHSIAARLEASLLEFPYDLVGLRGQQIGRLCDWADVIHIHDAAFGFGTLRKPVVITHHGTKFRKAPDAYIKGARQMMRLITVATPDLTRFGPPLMPDCRPDLSQYRNLGNEFTVIHAPTKRDVKGTKRVIAACKKVGVKLDLIENLTWEECMKRKGRGHLLIDQFKDGYGCNAIEAWSMGIPVISDGTDEVIDAIYNKFKGIPFVRPYSTLEDTIVNLRDDRNAWATAAAVGHQHYLDYHSYEATSRLAIWVYEQAIERFWSAQEAAIKGRLARTPTLFEAESLILIRYLGKNSGETKWFPDNGTRATYTFSGVDPLRYVYEPDAVWFLEQEAKNGKPLFAKEDA